MKAVDIHNAGLYSHQRKLLVIIRNYEAVFFKRSGAEVQSYIKKIRSIRQPNGTVRRVADTILQQQ